MNRRLRKSFFKLLPTLLIITSLLLATFFSYFNIYTKTQKLCWSRLENASNIVVNEIQRQFNDDINILKLIAQSMENDANLESHEDFLARVKSFQAVSLFERIDIEYPDNSLVLQDGSIVDCIHSFDELVKMKEHMSNPKIDSFTNKYSIFYYVPVTQNNQPAAYLIGVINCEYLSDYFKTKVYDGQTTNYIIDTNSKKLVMSDFKQTDAAEKIMKNYTLDSEYSSVNAFQKIIQLKSGSIKYHNNNEHYYMYYCPVGLFDWELLIVVKEDVAFESLMNTQQNYIILISFITILLAIYFGFNVYRIHKINQKEKQAEKEKEEIAHKLDIANTLLACVKELSSNVPIHTSIHNLLEIINNYFNAERSYIIEINHEGNVDSIFEYRKQSSLIYTVENQKKELQNLDFSPIFTIDKEIIYFKKILNEIPENTQIYTALKNQNIQDLIIVPFKDNSEVYALLGIDNPTKNTEHLDFVHSIKYFIGESLKREKETVLLEKLSYEDVLTHTFNRNKYNEFVEKNATKTLHHIGIAVFDLNGLKQVNDQYGHLAGDTLIQITASIFQQVFSQYTYRTGGDEFVVIQSDISKEEFLSKIKRIENRARLNEISISKGVLWKEECSNLYELVQEADQIMYKDKTQFYSQSKNDRRRR